MLQTQSPLLTLLALGISVLLLGGFIGGTLSRHQQINQEIKDMQQQQQEVLQRIETTRKQALENEQRALAQIDSVYQVLEQLTIREGKVRGNIQQANSRIQKSQEDIDHLRKEFSTQSKSSAFTLYGN